MATGVMHDVVVPADDGLVLKVPRRAAYAAADAGHYVFPLKPGQKVPAVNRWRTVLFDIGIATGPSALVVVDLDQSKAGRRSAGARHGLDVLAQLAAAAEAPVPTDTFTVETPSVIHGNPAWGQHCLQRPEPVALGIVKSELSTGAQQRDVATAAWRSVLRLVRRVGGGER